METAIGVLAGPSGDIPSNEALKFYKRVYRMQAYSE